MAKIEMPISTSYAKLPCQEFPIQNARDRPSPPHLFQSLEISSLTVSMVTVTVQCSACTPPEEEVTEVKQAQQAGLAPSALVSPGPEPTNRLDLSAPLGCFSRSPVIFPPRCSTSRGGYN